MNKWFKKFPYPGWLILIVVTLTTSIMSYHREAKRFSHENLAAEVQRDFRFRDSSIDSRIRSGMFENVLRNNFSNRLPVNFFFYIVKDSNTMVWNNNLVDVPYEVKYHPEAFLNGSLQRLPRGYFYLKTWQLGRNKNEHSPYAVSIIPILYNYPIENQYFQSHFIADSLIPNNTQVLEKPVNGAFPVLDKEGKTIFYLHFLETKNDYFTVSYITWLLAIICGLCIIIWVHEFCYGIGLRTGKPLYGFFVLLLFVVPVSYVLRRYDFPVGFQNSKIFSPEIYSTTEVIKSLGDLLIFILFNSWVFIYFIAYIPLSERLFFKKPAAERILHFALAVLCLTYVYSYFGNTISKLIIDSKISFEAGNFSNLNVFTLVGIFTVVVLTFNFLILLGIINRLLGFVVPKFHWRVGIFLGLSIVISLAFAGKNFGAFEMVVILLAFISLLLVNKFGFPLKKFRNHSDLRLASSTYIWFAMICSLATIEIYYFNYSKEIELRKLFAGKQELKDEGNAAFKFIGIMDQIEEDSMVNGYFHDMHNAGKKKNIAEYIKYVYLNDYSHKFNVGIYFYDKNRMPVLQDDSVDNVLLRYADSVNKAPFAYGLQDVENVKGGNYIYWFLSPFSDPDNDDTLGYIGFNIFADKRYKKGSALSFFDVKKNETDVQYYDNYSYAVYHNSNLWTQSGDIAFPYQIQDNLKKGETRLSGNFRDNSTLLYKPSADEIISVIYNRNLLTNIVSLFSYVLAIALALWALIFLMRHFIFYPGRIPFIFKNLALTIRSKVNLTILTTVFLSLFVVGFITLSFLSSRYKDTQRKNLQSLLMFYSQYIAYTSEENHINIESLRSDKFATYSEFSYQMSRLAEEQGAEVNIYNLNGRLIGTSQIDVYQKGLLSRYMDRESFLYLTNNKANEYIKQEHLGQLKYQSLYAPVRNKYDKVIAYLNIPYYASGVELNNEISNVLVTLVNVYALIFFLSGICAIFISNSIIRSFKLLIDQFRNIRLHHNEYIQWPYRDEIALLVNEYNSMMHKVEMMATRLARTEREAAWRDIARQVAHEIKNPLTPMKLNIQYLQQAIESNRPDVESLALKVADVLMDQIENLNIIASEFSSFAKMPDASPEDLEVHHSLQTLIYLFQKNNNVEIDLVSHNEKLTVYMDKSYFIRVFTNLLQNAIQSIDTTKGGKVIISYEQIEHNIVIVVQDNGCGIPKELQEKLFQPYFTTKTSGTGLGLPMTKSLIENSDGSIKFETEEGSGTRFIITLPVGEH